MKTWMVAAIAALVAVTLFAVSPGASGVAYAEENVCGNDVVDVPDTGSTFDFTEACEAHDDCYADFAGGTPSQRKACDDAFLADMVDSCNEMWGRFNWRSFSCKSVAAIYYTGVRIGGWAFF